MGRAKPHFFRVDQLLGGISSQWHDLNLLTPGCRTSRASRASAPGGSHENMFLFPHFFQEASRAIVNDFNAVFALYFCDLECLRDPP